MGSSNETNAPRSRVAVTRCADYGGDKITEVVERQFSLLGGVGKFINRGDRVLLKPNFIVPRPRAEAVQTDPAVILAVAKIARDFGAHPFVGDSPAWSSTAGCIKALGMEDDLKRLGVGFKQLDKPKRHTIAGSSIGISGAALEADKIINLPKLKTHQQLVATFAVKNMFGCVCGKEKAFWHFARGKSHEKFCEMLIGIYKLLAPVVTIIDGVVAMEGPGPINGRAKELGFIVGGIDPVACEMVCCELINLNPDEVPIIQTAKRIGFGCSDFGRIDIVGDDYADFICTDFEPAQRTPLRFSFPHICRSAAKQLILLAKAGAKRS